MRAAIVIGVVIAFCATSSTAAPTALIEHMRRHADRLKAAVATGETVGDVWRAPLPTDCRSPCPGLNMLANHGFLPRDGKNIDAPMLYKNFINVYGMGKLFASLLSKSGSKKFTDPATGKFSLCALLTSDQSTDQASHDNGVEHYASVTRLDRPGNTFTKATDISQRSPSMAQIQVFLDSSTNGRVITFEDYARARRTLWDRTYAAKPWAKGSAVDKSEHMFAAAEGCLILGLLSGNSNGGKLQISTEYARSILFEEKFPVGWQKSTRTFGTPQLLSCLARQGFSYASAEIRALASKWFSFI